jgi:hypothetical protein
MTNKWYLRDWLSPQRIVVGTLKDVHNSGGVIGIHPGDSDTNVLISPNDATKDLLLSRFGGPNTATSDGSQIECEVNVTSDGRDQYENWVRTMLGLQVTAQGVYVDDTEHDNKSELHPLDIVVAQVNDSQIGNWADQIASQLHLELGLDMFLYRFAAASDNRAGIAFEGPPLAEFDRTTVVSLPMPSRPGGNPSLNPEAQWKSLASSNAQVSTEPGSATDTINLVVQCTGVGFGDPGYVLGEVAVYWVNSVLQLNIDPMAVAFGTINPGMSKSRAVHITNVGTGSVALSVPGPPQGIPSFPFDWQAIPATTLASGGVIAIEITFSPSKAGQSQSGFSVESNAQGSPQHVTMTGTGSKVIEQ